MSNNPPQQNNSKLSVRVVSPEEQLGSIDTSSLLDTRKKQGKKFGATFFLRPKEAPATEADSWKYLEEKFAKRIKN